MFTSLFDQIKSAFYTYKRFTAYIIALVSTDLLKRSTALFLTMSGKMGLVSAAAIFSIAPLVGGALGIWNFRDKIFLRSNQARRIMRNLVPYSKWIFLSDVTKSAFSYAPTFMLVKLMSAKAAGIYGPALNLSYAVPILITSFSSVLLPEISRFQEISQFEKHLKMSLRGLSCMAALIIACLFFSGKFIVFFFGHRYAESIVIFNWLILNYLLSAANATLLYPMLYSLKKNRVAALADLTKLILMILGCLFVIPTFGIQGPAILALILNTASTTFLLVYVINHIDRVKLAALKISFP